MAQKYSLFVIIVTFIVGCKQESTSSATVPAISLKSVEQVKLNGKDSSVNITLSYADGDGDIGLNESDTFPPFNYGSKYFNNILVSLYSIENGIASKIPIPLSSDTVNYDGRITNLTPTGKSKSITGDIQLFIKAVPYPGIFPDSMFYTFSLYDRALHHSNTVRTQVLKFTF